MKELHRNRLIFGTIDTLIVILSFLLAGIFKPGFYLRLISNLYFLPLIIFLIIWMTISHFSNKFRLGHPISLREILKSIFISNFIILAVISILLLFFLQVYYSRIMIFGTILFATFFEIILAIIYHSLVTSEFLQEWIGPEYINGNGHKTAKETENDELSLTSNRIINEKQPNLEKNISQLKTAMSEMAGNEATQWIATRSELNHASTLVLSTTTRFNIDNQPDQFFQTIINLAPINNIQRINKFFESVNSKLPMEGIFIGCGETYLLRKEHILHKYPPGLNYGIYTADFIFKRVFPKLKLTRKIYFLITRGKNRVISLTETLGRLYSCGFEVMEEQAVGKLLYWKARKIKTPEFDYHPTYGLLIRLKRIGKNGKVFNVYKFRTMHAYSEYVQEHIYKQHNLDVSGKFRNDYRITTLGKFMRKFWLDELPMLFNIIKGDMKIVGVRPLSKHYYNLYAPDLQQMRIKYKPGLIPPYYAQFPTPSSLEDTQANEKQYLTEYATHPFRTDLKYFFKAMHNILIKHARSK